MAWLVQRLRLPRPLAAALLGAGVWLLSRFLRAYPLPEEEDGRGVE